MPAGFEGYIKSFPPMLMEIEGKIGRYLIEGNGMKKLGYPHE